jgi:hypothetical protein
MEKGELYSVLNSEFWKELTGKINVLAQQEAKDLINMDHSTDASRVEAVRTQARYQAFTGLNSIIEEIKEEAIEEVKDGTEKE